MQQVRAVINDRVMEEEQGDRMIEIPCKNKGLEIESNEEVRTVVGKKSRIKAILCNFF